MLSKEKILLVAVAAVLGGIGAMDGGYRPVSIPPTKAPEDIPPVPPGSTTLARSPRPAGRSILEFYSDLMAPPFAALAPLPLPRVPLAVPPVRPWFHLDAAKDLRHYFFEPEEAPQKEEEPEAATAGDTPVAPDAGDPALVAKEAPPKEVDLSLFDWVIARDGLGQKMYGKIELMPDAQEAKKSKYLLLVDSALEFTFWPITPKDGKFQGGPAPFRARTDLLGFADTFANNYGSKRALMENAAPSGLGVPALRELAAFAIEEAGKPKYRKRECLTQAAADFREALRKNNNDRDTLKDLGRILRRLHDLDGEAQLYDWWLAFLPGDEEMLGLSGEVLEMMGLTDRAKERYEKSLLTQPDGRIRLRLAGILLASGSLGDARKAVEVFRKAVQDGERLAGTVGEARALMALGDFAGAEPVLARVAAPDRDGAWYNAAGAVAYARGKLDEAKGNFQAALEKSPAGDEQFAIARTNLAVAKARLAALLPEDSPARRTELLDAVKTAEDALKDDPLNYYWPLVAKAYALRALAEKDRAVESLQDAVAAWPQEAYGRYLLGEFLLRDGRPAEARTQFLEGARLSPRFPDALGGVGRARGGSPGESKEYLRRATGLEPKAPLWPLLSARMAILDEGMPLNQRLLEAQKDLAYLLEKVDRNSYLGLVTMGWVRYYLGDPDDAIARWNQALGLTTGAGAGNTWEQKQVDEIRAWVKEAIQRVYKWKNTRIWRDEFNRPDGPTIGNGWTEEEKTLKITLKNKAAQFGPGQAANNEYTCLSREWDAAKTLKASFEVEMAPTENAQLEVIFRLPQGKIDNTVLALVRKGDGTVVLRVKKDQRTKESEEFLALPDFKWPEDGKVSFAMVKMNEERGVITLLLNGKAVAGAENMEIQNFIKSRSAKLRMEVKCSAPGGTEVNCRVEAAEVWLDVQ
jgi:tetratricopeptide (TPR) repeat protein